MTGVDAFFLADAALRVGENRRNQKLRDLRSGVSELIAA